jgi:hypothetical protein
MYVSWEDSAKKCQKGETVCMTGLERSYKNRMSSLLNSKNAKDRARGAALKSTYDKINDDTNFTFHVTRSDGEGSGELEYHGAPGNLIVDLKGDGASYGKMPDIQKLGHEFQHGEQFLDGRRVSTTLRHSKLEFSEDWRLSLMAC